MNFKLLYITPLVLKLFYCGFYSSDNLALEGQQLSIPNDSISYWIRASKNKTLHLEKRKQLLKKAYYQIKHKEKDSLTALYLNKIADGFYKLNDTLLFKTINGEALHYANALKDSLAIANVHWSYGDYYNNKEVYDTAYRYYKMAYKHFDGLKKDYEAARMLYTMAYIRGRFRDYAKSEVLTTEAIKKFKTLKNHSSFYKNLCRSYKHLAALQKNNEEYQNALNYYKKALQYAKKMGANKDEKIATIFNNIGTTYLAMEKYKKALNYFTRALTKTTRSVTYARLIDNRAYCKLKMGDTVGVKSDLFRSLHIRDSVGNKTDILTSKIRLSAYYTYIQDTTTAIYYAKEANVLAKKIKNGRDYMATLDLLAKLDTQKKSDYQEIRIHFSDSIQKEERKIRDTFTRIEFEVKQVEEDNIRLTQQRKWIFVTSIGVILILSLFYKIRAQKNKNEKLILEAEQQKANEQVYLLTLGQQAQLEEEKIKERNRISGELHEGILGKLFGIRMNLGQLNVKGDGEETHKEYLSYIKELRHLEKDIRKISHQLHTTINTSEVSFNILLNQLFEKKSTLGKFKCKITIDETINWKNINDLIKVNIYRILQEASHNIVKYAKASCVNLKFSMQKKTLSVSLKDDGIGFDPKIRKKGIGIKNMRSRIHKLNGTFHIKSIRKEGTLLYFTIPLNKTHNV